tara:strand:+ start:278 stop:400 length:123 start_codon:yes stop_codon:yes gene_type:complete
MKEKKKVKATVKTVPPVKEVTQLEKSWFDFYRINYNAFNT